MHLFFVVFPITPKETATVKHMFLLSLLLLSLSLFSAEIIGKVVGVSEQGHSIQGTDLSIFDDKYVMNDEEWDMLCDKKV